MAGRTVLVTAFEPFGGEAVNASWEAARRIDGWRFGDVVVAARRLSCAYEVCVEELVAAVERLQPAAILLTGQAARRGVVSVERFARNRVSKTARDNRGALGAGYDGPAVLEATASAAAVRRAIEAAGVAARMSSDAGAFVCNHLYYRALLAGLGAPPAARMIFVHLPATPGQSPPRANSRRLDSADAARALGAAVGALLRENRPATVG